MILLRNFEQFRFLRADLAIIPPRAVEEILQFEPEVRRAVRHVLLGVIVRDKQISR